MGGVARQCLSRSVDLVLDGVHRVVGLVAQVVERALGLAEQLVALALALEIVVVGQVASRLLHAALGLVDVLTHVGHPPCGWGYPVTYPTAARSHTWPSAIASSSGASANWVR